MDQIAGQFKGRIAEQVDRQGANETVDQGFGQVLSFPAHRLGQLQDEKCTRLVASFAAARRAAQEVFWLKGNAERLNILECTGLGHTLGSEEGAWAPLTAFYEDAGRQLCFFRQYYRFILSICMDLEDLGLASGAAYGHAERGCRIMSYRICKEPKRGAFWHAVVLRHQTAGLFGPK